MTNRIISKSTLIYIIMGHILETNKKITVREFAIYLRQWDL